MSATAVPLAMRARLIEQAEAAVRAFVDGDEAVRQALHVWADWLETHEDGLGPILRVYTEANRNHSWPTVQRRRSGATVLILDVRAADVRAFYGSVQVDEDEEIASAYDFNMHPDALVVRMSDTGAL